MKLPDHLETIQIDALIPYARNSRTHSEAQVAQIAASIKEFGFTSPILVDKDGGIIAGHGRLLAARKLGIKQVPCIRMGHLTPTQARALVIADNKLALNAGWDNEMLRVEFAELELEGYDLAITGFALEEIEALKFDDDAEAEMPELKDGDKEPFQQKTFTLHDDQAEVVDNAITLARTNPLADTGLNENTNGNALALICHQWLEARNGKR
jgi:ParB-like chromosome segregation protein Spo0J